MTAQASRPIRTAGRIRASPAFLVFIFGLLSYSTSSGYGKGGYGKLPYAGRSCRAGFLPASHYLACVKATLVGRKEGARQVGVGAGARLGSVIILYRLAFVHQRVGVCQPHHAPARLKFDQKDLIVHRFCFPRSIAFQHRPFSSSGRAAGRCGSTGAARRRPYRCRSLATRPAARASR